MAKVIDAIGFSAVNECHAACAYGGEVAVMGLRDATGPSLDIGTFGKWIRGIAVGSGMMYRAFQDHLEVSGGKPVIGRRFPFPKADDGLRALTKPGVFVKLVVELE